MNEAELSETLNAINTGAYDKEVEQILAEFRRLRQWVSDCQSGMYVNCVYCGHRYGPDKTTPVSHADLLKAHIEVCPDHPMSELKAQRDTLLSEIAGVKGELSAANEIAEKAEKERDALKATVSKIVEACNREQAATDFESNDTGGYHFAEKIRRILRRTHEEEQAGSETE